MNRCAFPREKLMARRSSIASLVLPICSLAAVLGVGGILGYNHFVKAQADKSPDKYEAFKTILPSLRKELASGEWKQVRLDEMTVTPSGDAVAVEYRGVWLYEGTAPTDERKRTLHTFLKTRSKALLKEQ